MMKLSVYIARYFFLFLPLALLAAAILWRLDLIKVYHEEKAREIVMDMDYGKSAGPQSRSLVFDDSIATHKPPENTVPRYSDYYTLHQTEYELAEERVARNPIIPNDYSKIKGESLFGTHCIYCHGEKGRGDGPVITDVELAPEEEGFPAPPDLTREEAKQLSDKRIFHILSAGQNLMFPVAHKFREFERWMLVHHIRRLQGKHSKED